MRRPFGVFQAVLLAAAVTAALASTSYATTISAPTVVVPSLEHEYLDGSYIMDLEPSPWPQESIETSFAGGDQVVVRFEAPTGKKFVVDYLPGGTSMVFRASAKWTDGSFPTLFGYDMTEDLTFEGLSGTAPSLTSFLGATYGSSGNSGGFGASVDFAVTGDFEFTALELTFTLLTGSVGTKTFSPESTGFMFYAMWNATGSFPDTTLMSLASTGAAPEPASLLLALLGLPALAARRRRSPSP